MIQTDVPSPIDLRTMSDAVEWERTAMQVKTLLKENGGYLVCDHYCGEGGMQNDQLYMSSDEQQLSLREAGFSVTLVLIKGGRVLYHAT